VRSRKERFASSNRIGWRCGFQIGNLMDLNWILLMCEEISWRSQLVADVVGLKEKFYAGPKRKETLSCASGQVKLLSVSVYEVVCDI
jgi:hypothetical protein